MEYFKSLIQLLKVEQEEDKNQYIKLTSQNSLAEKRLNGITWYPLAIKGDEMSRGDYLTVEFERTSHHELSHQFKQGMPVALFSNYEPSKDRVEGTVLHVQGNRIKVTFKSDELPDWSSDGKLGLDLLFDDNSYAEMFSALKQANELIETKAANDTLKVLVGEAKPSFDNDIFQVSIPHLNSSQNAALNKILAAKNLAIVHGPPGTGKTTTIVEAIKQVLKSESQILVCAPSNTAVDLLSEKLAKQGIKVLRVGNPARVNESLNMLTVDYQMESHLMMKDAKKLKKQAQEYKNMAYKYKRNFGKEEREQRKLLMNEAHKIMKEVGNMEEYIAEDLFKKAQVIAATPVGANNYLVRNLKFKTVIIDEAGQALEPQCWIPILKAEKVILAGDHCQLPPTVKSNEASKNGLSNTLLEKCIALHPESVVMLEEQYRMHTDIMTYSGTVFYNNLLKAHASVAQHQLHDDLAAITFIDTAGCSFDEKQDGTRISNPEEASLLIRHLESLLTDYQFETLPTIGVISPYKEQVNTLKELSLHSEKVVQHTSQIAINTIDSFQGQEKDVIYISMVRSNDKNEIGFLADIRRMNVAMTRAKKRLVIIGDSSTLGNHPFYANFLKYAESLNCYQSAWEFM